MQPTETFKVDVLEKFSRISAASQSSAFEADFGDCRRRRIFEGLHDVEGEG